MLDWMWSMFEVDAREYVRLWWLIALKGFLTMIFGFFAIVWPGATLFVLLLLFGAFVFFSGVLALLAVVSGRISSDQRWLVIVEGGVGVGIGLFTFFYPRLSIGALLFLVAIWAILIGAIQIISAVNLRGTIADGRQLAVSGILSVALGIVFLAFPIGALATIAFLLGMVAFVIGAVTLVFALRLRSLEEFDDSIVGEQQAG